MLVDSNVKYSKEHEWVRVEGNIGFVGITNYAQLQLGDIVYVELPDVGMDVEKDEVVCTVESVKTAADILTPMSGEVKAVNKKLEDAPEMINEEPYEAWIMQLELSDKSELDDLMDESEYGFYCENEE